jgi:outer membrane lipoprotein SlyB
MKKTIKLFITTAILLALSTGNNFAQQLLLTTKRGGLPWVRCCICVTEPCPCKCIGFDEFPINGVEVLSSSPVSLKDEQGTPFALLTIKGNVSELIRKQDAQTWIGELHNIVVAKSMAIIEAKLKAMKANNKKPSLEELIKLIEETIISIYNSLGLKDKHLTLAKVITKKTLASLKNAKEFKGGSAMSIKDMVLNTYKVKETDPQGQWLKLTFDGIKGETESDKITKKVNILNSRASIAVKDDVKYVSISSANAVAKSSTQFWLDYAQTNSAGAISKSAAGDIASDDVSGAAGGAAGGAVAGSLAGGVGAGPGAAVGAVTGAVATSVTSAVSKFIKWLW